MFTLLIVAILGLCVSLVIHFCTLFAGFALPNALVYLVNAGFLITFWSRLIILKVTKRELPLKGLFKTLFGNQPAWKKLIAGILITYGVVIFIFFTGGVFITAYNREGGKLPLHDMDIGLSAAWIAVYTEEIATLYCYICLQKASVRHCPNGHAVLLGQTYCEKCGLEIRQE